VEELIKNFFEKAKITSKSKTKVIIDGRLLDSGDFFAHCLSKYKFFEDFVQTSGIWKLSDKEKNEWVRKFWAEYFAFDRNSTVYTSDAFEGSDINPTDFELVIDYHTGKKVVFNNKLRVISKMHPDAYLKALTAHQRKLVLDQGTKLATFSFNPYNTFERRVIILEAQKVVEFNCFTPPAWRCNDDGRLDISLEDRYYSENPPKIFAEFMEHLIPNRGQREYVYHWMHQAIFSRNETYLCLNGKKGAGKNLLCELLGKLVGEEYYRKANERFFDEGFNSVLDRARLILLDELRVENGKHQNRLKSYINKGQNIERKGHDAEKTVETFNSYIINNNDIGDMLLVWDDRRFSVPDLTENKLLDVWPQSKIDEFAALFEDTEFLRKVGFWLKHHGRSDKFGTFYVLRGERYWKIVFNSLTEWQKIIVEAITSKDKTEYSISDLKQTYKRRVDANRFPFKIQKIGDFVDDYRHRGEHKLGTLEGLGENAVIIPSEEFKHIAADDEFEGVL
jgi:hypothetical protein